MEHVDRLKKKRRTTRGLVTKQINRIEECLTNEDSDVRRLKQYQTDLSEKLVNLKELDEQILEGLLDNDEDDEVRDKEAEEAQEIKDRVLYCLSGIEQALLQIEREETGERISLNGSKDGINSEDARGSQSRKMKKKLPKLEIKKFSGKVQEWSEFWDSFKSAIDSDPDLANINKFKYLRSFLEKTPRRVIAGLSLTEANYSSAVAILKERYAKPSVIKRAHINDLVNIQPVFNEKSQVRLRNFYDDVETHFRGLQALGVDQETYSSIVVPVLMDKLPDSVRINMIRFGDSNHLEWDLEQMLDALGKEIEIRESHVSIFKSPSNLAHMQKTGTSVRTEQPKERITTASALFVKDGTERCVFCSSAEHKTEQCSQVIGAEERKRVLMKFARCFSCLNKGHKSFKCKRRVTCRFCQAALYLIAFVCITIQTDVCIKRDTLEIPSDHLFHEKAKPLVLGHRGQPRKFQENTIEGIKSVIGLKGDGFETDIYLTDYNQLVLFHDDNAKALTGVDKKIWQMTPQEIKNLTYKKTLTYGSRGLKYTFPGALKVGLLDELLNDVKDTNMLMYLEMKPSRLIYNSFNRSIETGQAVARLVTKYGLEKKVFLVSFDFMKSLAAKRENPNLVVGSFYSTKYWNRNAA